MVAEKDILLIGSIGKSLIIETDIINGKMTFSGAVAYLNTFLTNRGYKVDYVDSIEVESEDVVKKISENSYRLIGISTTLCNSIYYVQNIIQDIKKLTNTPIVVGGIFVAKLLTIPNGKSSTIRQKALKMMDADYFIDSYQGEYSLKTLIEALKQNTPVNKVPNIFFKCENEYKYTINEEEDNILENNVVNWELISNKDKLDKILPVRTSQSCLFNCSFCTYKAFAGEYRCISINAIEMELNSIFIGDYKYHINFIDDTFNVPKQRFKEILKMLIKNKYKIKWNSYIRCQYIDEHTVKLMKKSGCEEVFLGIESGSQKMLNLMNKQVKVKDLNSGIKLLKKYGIKTHGFFFVGFPGETEDTVRETIKFINESELDIYSITPWINDPMAPIFEMREELQIIGTGHKWSHLSMTSDDANEYVDKIVSSTTIRGMRTQIN